MELAGKVKTVLTIASFKKYAYLHACVQYENIFIGSKFCEAQQPIKTFSTIYGNKSEIKPRTEFDWKRW